MHGCCADPSASPHFGLHRWLADFLLSRRSQRSDVRVSNLSGFKTQCQDKRSPYLGVLWDSSAYLAQLSSTLYPEKHQARPGNYGSLPSKNSSSHGSCVQGISSKGQSRGFAPFVCASDPGLRLWVPLSVRAVIARWWRRLQGTVFRLRPELWNLHAWPLKEKVTCVKVTSTGMRLADISMNFDICRWPCDL
jgi:hypothetical protein